MKAKTGLGVRGVVVSGCLMAFGLLLALGMYLSVERSRVVAVAPPLAEADRTPIPKPSLALPVSTVQPTTSLISIQTPQVTILSAAWDEKQNVLAVEFEAAQMTGDYLFETPLLRSGSVDYAPSPESLEQARVALLRLVTGGRAKAELVFPITTPSGVGELIFNPPSPANSLVNPRVAIPVTWLSPAPTPHQ